jgi:hypothetical protein
MGQANDHEHLSNLWSQTSEAKRLGKSDMDLSGLDVAINTVSLNNALRLVSLKEMTKGRRMEVKAAEICQAIEADVRFCTEVAIYLLKKIRH